MAHDLRGAKVILLYSPGSLAVDCAGGLWRGIERGLLDLGAQVRTLNLALLKRHILPGDAVWPADNGFIQGMIGFLRESWPGSRADLCLCLLHDAYLTAELQETLRARARRVINYPLNLLDQPHRFLRALEFCDETFCAEEEALAPLRAQAGEQKIRYVPMACDPWNFRALGWPAKPRVLFVGSLYADRQWLLDRCAQELPVSAYGSGHGVEGVARGIARELVRHGRVTGPVQATRMLWRAARNPKLHVSDEEYVRLASEHGVSVGFSEVRQEQTHKLLHKVRLREYEAPMSGLCHLAKRLPETQRHYDDGREMLLFDDPEEVPELLRRIARGAIDFRAVGKAARARAERDHTWTVRLRAALCG
jgi:Glycosyl transferases group 1